MNTGALSDRWLTAQAAALEPRDHLVHIWRDRKKSGWPYLHVLGFSQLSQRSELRFLRRRLAEHDGRAEVQHDEPKPASHLEADTVIGDISFMACVLTLVDT